MARRHCRPAFARPDGVPRCSTTPRTGTLHVVATPIGNLADLSPRALDTLRAVAAICAEDTRHTRQLLAHYGARTPAAWRCTNTTKSELADKLVARLLAGESLALVSDAGTPLVSDPGLPPGARRARGGHAGQPGAGRMRVRSPR